MIPYVEDLIDRDRDHVRDHVRDRSHSCNRDHDRNCNRDCDCGCDFTRNRNLILMIHLCYPMHHSTLKN